MGLALDFNKGFRITLGSFPGVPSGETLLCTISERMNGMEEYGILESVVMQQHTWFSFFRAFAGDIKVEVYYCDPEFGMLKVGEESYDPRGKNVKIDLQAESLFDAKCWAEQALAYMREKQCQVYLGIRGELASEIERIFNHSGMVINSPDDDIETYAHFEIGRFDMEENGVAMTGTPQGYQDLYSGWICKSGWRYYKSFKNPRDWETLESYEIARDILGLSEISSVRKGYSNREKWESRRQVYDSEFFK